ncbi:MAG TPA: response regulator [Vicinamibacterales bacterium]|nr:response regulator [Vicinamibacterales bacterium]
MPLRLLLIDDDTVDRMTVRRLLRQMRADAVVEECTSGEEALARLSAGTFDCVLLDYNIPGADGLATLKALREQGHALPVIVLTGQGDEEVAVALMKAGAADYLNKNSLSGERLERSLRYALALHRAEEERRQLLERERRAREQAQAANRAKDEFLATLSHELRTPLNAILGWSRLLASGNLDAENTRRAIEIIDRNARLQAQLIEDLLDISRIITGKLRLDLQTVTVNSIVEAALESVRPSADARGISIEAELADAGDSILCDPRRMQQVIWNLLTNAIKFTPEGGRVAIALQRQESLVTITVTDTGIGIEPAFLPYVFDRFRQQDGASTRAHGGLGLGLSIVRHLVELHGGTVEARSAGPGEGSSFVVRVPLAPLRATQIELMEEEAAGRASTELPSLAGLRVLVVDNDPDARGLLRAVLESCGAMVDDAASAADALARLEMVLPDVLLSDIAMPGEDGYSLIRRIRGMQGPARLIPAAAFTAHATAADRTRALLSGYQAHIPKPVEPAELAAVVAALAGRTVVRTS